MSIRPRSQKSSGTMVFDPNLLRTELDAMRSAALLESAQARASVNCAVPASGDQSTGVVTQAMREFDKLSPQEQQAASLGVHPEAFRPLKELNEQHFRALQQANALSPSLEASIKAFQVIASDS